MLLVLSPQNARAHQGGEFGYTNYTINLDDVQCEGNIQHSVHSLY